MELPTAACAGEVHLCMRVGPCHPMIPDMRAAPSVNLAWLIKLFQQLEDITRGKLGGGAEDREQVKASRPPRAEEVDRPDITNTPVAIVSVVTEGTPSQSGSTAILVEGDFVISNIPRMADSFALLFGLMYVLHLDYPKKLINTFIFIQKVLMGLDGGKPLKPCLLNLKNDLLLKK
ncbi:hypothetical protein F7725_013234 [Dissostichus mawsoni]|uniref:Uncharacterized protein n=1 Tax=Dissostichus mawsoni TaxID=36200 RepID=A0A7J5YPI1_DISMA|nr:hypothetical protein F7725_013234 [Dissostichus mawsoni]